MIFKISLGDINRLYSNIPHTNLYCLFGVSDDMVDSPKTNDQVSYQFL